MKIQKFEDIISWQKSKELGIFIYSCLRVNKDFSFRDQFQRAAISTSNNIAEGFERRSNNELKHFLYIAKGSCGEVRSMAHMALDLGYITEQEFDRIYPLSLEISRLLSGLIKTL